MPSPWTSAIPFPRISGKALILLLALGVLIVPPSVWYYAYHMAPKHLRVRHVEVDGLGPLRILQFSDLHYEVDPVRMDRIVRTINRQKVDFVCFTGDLVSYGDHFAAALLDIQRIKHPVYGVPGNHDYGRGRELPPLDAALRKTGGRLLKNESIQVAPNTFLVGLDEASIGDSDPQKALQNVGTGRRIWLFHEPAVVDALQDAPFLLALAGHSHGGQVRIPFIGAPVLPFMVGRYDWGLFETPAGPLYVTSGIGTFGKHVRFFCPPRDCSFLGSSELKHHWAYL